MNKFIYIGNFSDINIVQSHQTSFAGNWAEYNFINYFLHNENSSVVIYSYATNLYNSSKKIYLYSQKFKVKIGSKNIPIVSVPIIKVKFIQQLFAILFLNISLFNEVVMQKSDSSFDNIYLINANSFVVFSLPTMLTKLISRKIKTILFAMDGPYSTPRSSKLLKISNRYSDYIVRKYNIVISLTPKFIEDFCLPNQRTFNITPIEKEYFKFTIEKKQFDFNNIILFYSGGIVEMNGISLYLNSIKKLGDNFKMHFAGRGKDLEQVINAEDDRINYLGVLERADAIKYQVLSDILLIVRPTIYPFEYGIPFKIFEYLSSGTPIIASFMPAIPLELREFINFCEPNENSIIKLVNEITSNYESYVSRAKAGRTYMLDNCTWEKYSSQFMEILND